MSVHVSATHVRDAKRARVSTYTTFWNVVERHLGSRESGAGGDEDESLHGEDGGWK